jgi:hypothetical protein
VVSTPVGRRRLRIDCPLWGRALWRIKGSAVSMGILLAALEGGRRTGSAAEARATRPACVLWVLRVWSLSTFWMAFNFGFWLSQVSLQL